LALDLEDYYPSVLLGLHCWLGYLTCKIVSEMTYNVSSGTLSPTIIPYSTIQMFNKSCVQSCSVLWTLLYMHFFLLLLSQYLKSIMFQRVSPKTVGACGRLVVIQHGGKLLSSYLDEPFKDRAELALQLLSLVQMFWVRIFAFVSALTDFCGHVKIFLV